MILELRRFAHWANHDSRIIYYDLILVIVRRKMRIIHILESVDILEYVSKYTF